MVWSKPHFTYENVSTGIRKTKNYIKGKWSIDNLKKVLERIC